MIPRWSAQLLLLPAIVGAVMLKRGPLIEDEPPSGYTPTLATGTVIGRSHLPPDYPTSPLAGNPIAAPEVPTDSDVPVEVAWPFPSQPTALVAQPPSVSAPDVATTVGARLAADSKRLGLAAQRLLAAQQSFNVVEEDALTKAFDMQSLRSLDDKDRADWMEHEKLEAEVARLRKELSARLDELAAKARQRKGALPSGSTAPSVVPTGDEAIEDAADVPPNASVAAPPVPPAARPAPAEPNPQGIQDNGSGYAPQAPPSTVPVGQTGAMGPQGPPGPTGPAGPAGPQGDPGSPGAAVTAGDLSAAIRKAMQDQVEIARSAAAEACKGNSQKPCPMLPPAAGQVGAPSPAATVQAGTAPVVPPGSGIPQTPPAGGPEITFSPPPWAAAPPAQNPQQVQQQSQPVPPMQPGATGSNQALSGLPPPQNVYHFQPDGTPQAQAGAGTQPQQVVVVRPYQSLEDQLLEQHRYAQTCQARAKELQHVVLELMSKHDTLCEHAINVTRSELVEQKTLAQVNEALRPRMDKALANVRTISFQRTVVHRQYELLQQYGNTLRQKLQGELIEAQMKVDHAKGNLTAVLQRRDAMQTLSKHLEAEVARFNQQLKSGKLALARNNNSRIKADMQHVAKEIRDSQIALVKAKSDMNSSLVRADAWRNISTENTWQAHNITESALAHIARIQAADDELERQASAALLQAEASVNTKCSDLWDQDHPDMKQKVDECPALESELQTVEASVASLTSATQQMNSR
mmetsp:Transcript_25319/g.58834  ORF Transcript_25319/g.58834 Transcript_25319/m.58834 type:complete len:748 (-) Transcript_25319:63-2306(-)